MSLRPGKDPADFNRRSQGALPGLMGMQVTELKEGRVVIALEIRADLMAPNGFLHAGTIVSLADTAAGYACIAHLPEGAESFTTIELKANMLGTARAGTIRAEAKPVHLGKTTQVWDAIVYAGDSEKPLALFRCTQLVLYPKK